MTSTVSMVWPEFERGITRGQRNFTETGELIFMFIVSIFGITLQIYVATLNIFRFLFNFMSSLKKVDRVRFLCIAQEATNNLREKPIQSQYHLLLQRVCALINFLPLWLTATIIFPIVIIFSANTNHRNHNFSLGIQKIAILQPHSESISQRQSSVSHLFTPTLRFLIRFTHIQINDCTTLSRLTDFTLVTLISFNQCRHRVELILSTKVSDESFVEKLTT